MVWYTFEASSAHVSALGVARLNAPGVVLQSVRRKQPRRVFESEPCLVLKDRGFLKPRTGLLTGLLSHPALVCHGSRAVDQVKHAFQLPGSASNALSRSRLYNDSEPSNHTEFTVCGSTCIRPGRGKTVPSFLQ